jgi:hypothetical protein
MHVREIIVCKARYMGRSIAHEMNKTHSLWDLAMPSVTHYPEFSALGRGLRSIGSAVSRSIPTATAGAAATIKSYRRQPQGIVNHTQRTIPSTDDIERKIARRIFSPGSRIRYWL